VNDKCTVSAVRHTLEIHTLHVAWLDDKASVFGLNSQQLR